MDTADIKNISKGYDITDVPRTREMLGPHVRSEA